MKCQHCNQEPTEDGHDACIANLPDTDHACCAHGGTRKDCISPYIVYKGRSFYGDIAIDLMRKLGGNPPDLTQGKSYEIKITKMSEIDGIDWYHQEKIDLESVLVDL